MKRIHPALLSILGGLLLWAAWPVSPFTFLIFIALIPFLWFEDHTANAKQFLGFTYLMLLIWNIGTTWWMCNSTVPGGIAALLANSVLMSIPLFLFYLVKRRLGESVGYPALVLCWLSFEYIHLNWQLSWPWLTLGNVFASSPGWVQWYEYTGTSGGSLWVLLVNVLVYKALKSWQVRPAQKSALVYPIIALVLPVIISYLVKPVVAPAAGDQNIVVVQPNIDPYGKFEAGSQTSQLNLLIKLSEQQIDEHTSIVVWPETAISFPSGLDETRLNDHVFLMPVWGFLKRHPQLKLLSGIESYRLYNATNKSASARQIRNSEEFYDSYNTAAIFDSTGARQLYHKSKLVPGVETLPTYLRFLDKWFEEFGGTTGGYASQSERTVLTDPGSGYRIAPAICYESIYGEFMTEYVRNGANVITIITNDGWWGNTGGYRQHMQYARLRAIETRRWVVRSANTGISCYISPSGEVLDAQPWDVPAAIKRSIPPVEQVTFFALHGDLISRVALVIAAALLAWSASRYLINRLKKDRHGKYDYV